MQDMNQDIRVPLEQVAHTRSGDKGNTSNIDVFAYEPELFALLKQQLSAERFKAFHGRAITGEVLVSEGFTREVTDSPAYDESVPDKLVCTLCGEEKPATAE